VNPARSGYWHAVHLAEAGRYADAERRVRASLSRAPADIDLLVFLAYLLRMRERYAEALAACDAAVAAAPGSAAAHAERAETLIALYRGDEAVVAATEAVRHAPHDARMHVTRAHSLLSEEEYGHARAAARRALALAPSSVEALLAVALTERGAGDREAAAAAVGAALLIEPANPRAVWLHAMLDADRLRVGRSMRTLLGAARDRPDRPDIVSLLWPLRAPISGLRWWLPGAAALTTVAALAADRLAGGGPAWLPGGAGSGWLPGGAGIAARAVGGFTATAIALSLARILLPAGRTPWRCLPLAPALLRRAVLAGLGTVTATVSLLSAYAVAGRWWLPVLGVALAPIHWCCALAARIGSHVDDPGFRERLREIRAELVQVRHELREWARDTRRELRSAWSGEDR
jgi:tetratricopeptide (TPR) repeat protein